MEALYYIFVVLDTLCCDWKVYLSLKLNFKHCEETKNVN